MTKKNSIDFIVCIHYIIYEYSGKPFLFVRIQVRVLFFLPQKLCTVKFSCHFSSTSLLLNRVFSLQWCRKIVERIKILAIHTKAGTMVANSPSPHSFKGDWPLVACSSSSCTVWIEKRRTNSRNLFKLAYIACQSAAAATFLVTAVRISSQAIVGILLTHKCCTFRYNCVAGYVRSAHVVFITSLYLPLTRPAALAS